MSRFDAFTDQMINDFCEFLDNPRATELFKNPAYLIRTAHKYLYYEPKLAEELYTKAYEMDPKLGFIALYFRALAVLKQGHQHFEAKKKRVAINSTYHKRAKEDFCQAQFIAGEVSCYVGGVLAAFNSDPTCALSQQFNNIIGLLTLFQQQCQHAVAMIDECDNNHKESVIKLGKILGLADGYMKMLEQQKKQPKIEEEACELTEQSKTSKGEQRQKQQQRASNDDRNLIPHYEIDELMESGLKQFYNLDIAHPPPPFHVVAVQAILGVIQLSVGVILASTGGLSSFAWAFIKRF